MTGHRVHESGCIDSLGILVRGGDVEEKYAPRSSLFIHCRVIVAATSTHVNCTAWAAHCQAAVGLSRLLSSLALAIRQIPGYAQVAARRRCSVNNAPSSGANDALPNGARASREGGGRTHYDSVRVSPDL